MKRWRYEMTVRGGDGTEQKIAGMFDQGDEEASFQATLQEAQRHGYIALTGGQTEYGKPGTGGCRGPYRFERLLVELADPAVYGLPAKG